jgi:hypothetical protein
MESVSRLAVGRFRRFRGFEPQRSFLFPLKLGRTDFFVIGRNRKLVVGKTDFFRGIQRGRKLLSLDLNLGAQRHTGIFLWRYRQARLQSRSFLDGVKRFQEFLVVWIALGNEHGRRYATDRSRVLFGVISLDCLFIARRFQLDIGRILIG